MDQPTCIVGDFNAIVDLEEKSGGSSQLSSQNRRFSEWINGAELIDLGHHGPCFTWTNKRPSAANVSERLDRALGNVAWSLKHPKSAVFHLPRFNSDHMPILVRTEPKPIRNEEVLKQKIGGWLERILRQYVSRQLNKAIMNGRRYDLH